MKFYGNADLQQNYLDQVAIRLDSAFPVSPIVGQFAFKDKVLYICAEINSGLPIWLPLTKQITLYTHVQAASSATWEISHPLNTRSVNVTVYDNFDRVIMPDEITVNSNSSVTVSLATGVPGKAVVMTGHTDGNSAPVYAFEFIQTNASTTWTIAHNLDRNPIVRVFVGNQEVQPESVTFTDANTVTIAFSTAQSGYAKLL